MRSRGGKKHMAEAFVSLGQAGCKMVKWEETPQKPHQTKWTIWLVNQVYPPNFLMLGDIYCRCEWLLAKTNRMRQPVSKLLVLSKKMGLFCTFSCFSVPWVHRTMWFRESERNASLGPWGTHSTQNCGADFRRCRIRGLGRNRPSFEQTYLPCLFEMQFFLLIWFYQT